MHIEVEGKKYFDRVIKTIEATIRKMDNGYARDEALDKFLTSSKFVNEFCGVISTHFKGMSDWRIMRDEDLTDSTSMCNIIRAGNRSKYRILTG